MITIGENHGTTQTAQAAEALDGSNESGGVAVPREQRISEGRGIRAEVTDKESSSRESEVGSTQK